jgi:hypothetical protein
MSNEIGNMHFVATMVRVARRPLNYKFPIILAMKVIILGAWEN